MAIALQTGATTKLKEKKSPATIGITTILYTNAQNRFIFMNKFPLLKNLISATILCRF